MEIVETDLEGCRLVKMHPIGDERGYFARTFCAREFASHGLNPDLAQASISYNRDKGTLRGLHFQKHPAMEDKLVRCVRGAIFDVMVDIRPGSPTYGQWYGTELSESNNLQLYGAAGFAHGFQTLSKDTIVAYHIAQFYEADKTAGVRWNDPQIAIKWPLAPVNQSPRDLALPLLEEIAPAALLAFHEVKAK